MARPRLKPLFILGFLFAWALWSLFVITDLVPFLERHMHLHPAVTAWALCSLPGIAAVIWLVIWLQKE
jgi:hypothetical protein